MPVHPPQPLHPMCSTANASGTCPPPTPSLHLSWGWWIWMAIVPRRLQLLFTVAPAADPVGEPAISIQIFRGSCRVTTVTNSAPWMGGWMVIVNESAEQMGLFDSYTITNTSELHSYLSHPFNLLFNNDCKYLRGKDTSREPFLFFFFLRLATFSRHSQNTKLPVVGGSVGR